MSAAREDAEGRRVIVLGGSSEIACAIVHELQRKVPREVALVGRDGERLDSTAAQLRGAGCARVITVALNALDTKAHAQALDSTVAQLGGVDLAVVAVGVLGEAGGPGGLPGDIERANDVLRVNAVGAGSLLMHAAARLRASGGGAIVVLSSVAAQRPRRTNPPYGASKAALDGLAQALGDSLHDDGVRVLVVRPGFVHTRMTHGLEPAPLASTPEQVARAVVKGLEGTATIVWVPAQLRYVMIALRLLPRALFRRIQR